MRPWISNCQSRESRLTSISSTTEQASVPEQGAALRVSLLQQKLGQKAAQEPGFRFYALYDRIFILYVLEEALRRVRTNAGSPGVDGVTVEQVTLSEESKSEFLSHLRKELVEKTYRPSPVRRVWIPKSSGGRRPLGIPTVKDRVVQMACLLILEPIFESDFQDCSYGFRPGRSAHDALEEIRSHLSTGFCAVYDADLKSYFDTIDHRLLLRCMRRRVVDRSVLKLIKMWLECPVLESGKNGKPLTRSSAGTPQGGVISPLLANVYLHELDLRWHRADGPRYRYNARLVRYADDFVVLAKYIGEPIQRFLKELLEERMGLTLNSEKTRVIDLKEPGRSLDFLGYTFRIDRDFRGGTDRYLNLFPSKKSEKRIRDQVKLLTDRRQTAPLAEVVSILNGVLLARGRYYALGYPAMPFRRIDAYVQVRMYRFMRNRSQKGMKVPPGMTQYGWLKSLGLVRLGDPKTVAALRGHRSNTQIRG